MQLRGIVLILVMLGSVATLVWYLHSDSGGSQGSILDPKVAQRHLMRLAKCQWAYSAVNGGRGNGCYTDDVARLLQVVPAEKRERQIAVDDSSLFAAFEHVPDHKPYQGWVFELRENPPGDRFQNNFLFVARPAPGNSGPVWVIDKSEKPTVQSSP